LRVQSVVELTARRLRELGLDALLLDVDCTLTRYRSEELPPEVLTWMEELRRAGVHLCLVSNASSGRIRQLAHRLGISEVPSAMKPLPWGCRRAIRKLGCTAPRTAMVGDQLFTDVLAARLAGIKSILVRPIHPEDEPWYTRVKRPLERLLLP
jgi:uncharacterized protein